MLKKTYTFSRKQRPAELNFVPTTDLEIETSESNLLVKLFPHGNRNQPPQEVYCAKKQVFLDLIGGLVKVIGDNNKQPDQQNENQQQIEQEEQAKQQNDTNKNTTSSEEKSGSETHNKINNACACISSETSFHAVHHNAFRKSKSGNTYGFEHSKI